MPTEESGLMIRRATAADVERWVALRAALWPDVHLQTHRDEIGAQLESSDEEAFVAETTEGKLCGFIEAALRQGAEGCSSTPVGYVEGWYVAAAWRKRGIGRALVEAAEAWARERGCREMASDTEVENAPSQAAHKRLGYEEAERLVHFTKAL